MADIAQNMTISSSFNPSAVGNYVKFLGFDMNGKPGPYQLKVKTADDATRIVDKMKEEVAAIKAEEA